MVLFLFPHTMACETPVNPVQPEPLDLPAAGQGTQTIILTGTRHFRAASNHLFVERPTVSGPYQFKRHKRYRYNIHNASLTQLLGFIDYIEDNRGQLVTFVDECAINTTGLIIGEIEANLTGRTQPDTTDECPDPYLFDLAFDFEEQPS